MKTNASSWLRYIITIVLAFILYLLLMLVITGAILLQTVFSPSYMARQVDSSGYPEQVLHELRDIYISHGMASGIPEDVMLPLLTTRHIQSAAKAQIQSAYGAGRAYEYDRFEDEVYEALCGYALNAYASNTYGGQHGITADQGSTATDAAQGYIFEEGLRELARLLTDDFRGQIASPVTDLIGEAAVQYRWLFVLVFALTALFAILIALLITAVNRRVSSAISGYIYALGATALTCCAVPAAIYASGFTGSLNITPLSFRILLTSWLEGVARGYLIALIPVLAALTALVITWFVRRSRRHRFRGM